MKHILLLVKILVFQLLKLQAITIEKFESVSTDNFMSKRITILKFHAMSADELNSNVAYKHKITEELLKMLHEYNNKTVDNRVLYFTDVDGVMATPSGNSIDIPNNIFGRDQENLEHNQYLNSTNKQSQQIHRQMYMLANKYAAELRQNVVVIPAAAVASPEQKNLADYRNYMIAAAIGPLTLDNGKGVVGVAIIAAQCDCYKYPVCCEPCDFPTCSYCPCG